MFRIIRAAPALVITVVLAFFIIPSTPARAVDYYAIHQDGWLGGGIITGAFSGMDLNNDNAIDAADGEVFSYSVTFYGNDHIPTLNHGLTQLQFFRYTVGSTGFRPSAPLLSSDGTFNYDADDHLIYTAGFANWTGTDNDAVVTLLPEPATLGVVAMALTLFARRPRRGLQGQV